MKTPQKNRRRKKQPGPTFCSSTRITSGVDTSGVCRLLLIIDGGDEDLRRVRDDGGMSRSRRSLSFDQHNGSIVYLDIDDDGVPCWCFFRCLPFEYCGFLPFEYCKGSACSAPLKFGLELGPSSTWRARTSLKLVRKLSHRIQRPYSETTPGETTTASPCPPPPLPTPLQVPSHRVGTVGCGSSCDFRFKTNP